MRSRGGRGHRAQSAVDLRSVPSRRRRRRRADRLRGRARAQARAARARERRAGSACGPPRGLMRTSLRRGLTCGRPGRSSGRRLVALAAIWGASFIFIRVLAPALGPILTVDDARADRRRGPRRLLPDHRASMPSLGRYWRQYLGDRHRQFDAAVHAVRVRGAAHPGVVFGDSQLDRAALHRALRDSAPRRAAHAGQDRAASSPARQASRS